MLAYIYYIYNYMLGILFCIHTYARLFFSHNYIAILYEQTAKI